MSEVVMNFTGKTRLTDEEFLEFYNRLWESTPHYTLNWSTDVEIAKLKSEGAFNDTETQQLDGEVWDYLPGDNRYEISSLGRVKLGKEFIKQDDLPGKVGYLALIKPKNFHQKICTTIPVYNFVAKTFLGKEDGDGMHIHHIDNNGYDCSVKNLILLTPEQHKIVHMDRFLSGTQIMEMLNPERKYNEEKIKLHLSNYKIEKITIDCGEWKKNGRKYAHILPNKRMNLIDVSFKSQFDELYGKMTKNLHMYFAHLTSSQALCFNLFYPLMLKEKLEVVDNQFDKSTVAEFEHIEKDSFEKQENEKDKTNFDFYMECKGKKAFFEVKYTEQTFGYVSKVLDGDLHDKKYTGYYENQMKIVASGVSRDEFFGNYQLWRNICHVVYGDVYFVCLKDRTDLIADVNEAIKKCDKQFQDKIKILTIEEIVKKALKVDDEEIHNHYLEFSKKYLEY